MFIKPGAQPRETSPSCQKEVVNRFADHKTYPTQPLRLPSGEFLTGKEVLSPRGTPDLRRTGTQASKSV